MSSRLAQQINLSTALQLYSTPHLHYYVHAVLAVLLLLPCLFILHVYLASFAIISPKKKTLFHSLLAACHFVILIVLLCLISPRYVFFALLSFGRTEHYSIRDFFLLLVNRLDSIIFVLITLHFFLISLQL